LNSGASRRDLAWLGFLTFAALLLRALATEGNAIEFDGCGYVMHAWSIAQGRLTTPYWMAGMDHYYPPLYPFFIFLFNLVVRNWVYAAKSVSIVFSGLLLVPVFLLGQKIFSRAIALIACSLLVAHPLMVQVGSNAFSEPVFLFFVALSMLWGWKMLSEKKPAHAFLAGLMLGIADLGRAQAIAGLFSMIAVVFWFVLIQRRLKFSESAKFLALIVIGFYLAALPYDYYNYKKDGVWGLRQRMEFFKKGYPLGEGLDWYLQERTLNQDATSLLAFELSRNSSPLEFIRNNPREYLGYVKSDFKVMWHREFTGHRITSPILTLSLIFLVLVLLISPDKMPRSYDGQLFLMIWFAPLYFMVPLSVCVLDRYFLPTLIPLVLWSACGLDLFRKNIGGLAALNFSNRGLRFSEPGLWLILLLFCQPIEKVKKFIMDKTTYPRKESRWINEFTKGGPRKIIMSSMPYPALYSGNYWYMLPMDNINRTSHYAITQKADFLLADDHFYNWLNAPQDYADQYLSPFSKPGLNWLGKKRVHFKFEGKMAGKSDAFYKVDSQPPPKTSAVNIILISIDTLRADHLSGYGYQRRTSPNLDQIAEQGLRFEKVISQSPKTTPSHMTIFTSLYPEVHGAHRDYQNKSFVKLPVNWKTLPEILKASGFRTAAFTGGVQVAKGIGFERGFEVFEENLLRLKPDSFEPALQWLSQIKPDENFFLFIHTYQVHDPYCPPAPYNKLYDHDYEGWIVDDCEKLSLRDQPGKLFPTHNIFWGGAEKGVKGDQLNLDIISQRDTQHLVALYDGNIAYTDEILGRFLGDLKKRGVLGDGRTMLIITSDHGEEFREHGDFLHKKLYRETMQVPLIFYWPGKLMPGKVVKGQVRLIDLAPTVLDLIGLPVHLQMQGVSLKSAMASSDRAVLSAYSEDPFLRREFALRTEFTMYYQMENEQKKELYFEMLDAGEQTNLYTDQDDLIGTPGYILAKPGEIKSNYIKSIDNFHNYNNRYKIIFKAPAGKFEENKLAKEQIDELRALGYIK